MGLLDSLIENAGKGMLGKVLGGVTGQAATPANPSQGPVHMGLLGHIMDMMGNSQAGGLGALIAKLKAGGGGTLSKAVDSWVGTGPNQAVSADQITSALGQDQIAQLAAKFGIPANMVASHLSQILPELINHATPNGQVPDNSVVSSAMSALKSKLFGH